MESHDLSWNFGVNLSYPVNIRITQELSTSLSRSLRGRALVTKDKTKEHIFSMFFAVNGETAEAATAEGVSALNLALGEIGIEWLKIETYGIISSESLDQDLARIDSATGRMRPEAQVINLFRKEDN